MTIAFKKIVKDGEGDPEHTHSAMDAIMAETLRLLGYDNPMDVFDSSTKWY